MICCRQTDKSTASPGWSWFSPRVLGSALLAVGVVVSVVETSLSQESVTSWAAKMQERLRKMAEAEKKVQIYALHMEFDEATHTFICEGAVDIRFGEVRLRADSVRINQLTGETTASGNIILEYERTRIVGERLEINLKTRLGRIYSAEGFLEPSYYFKARRLERFRLDKYRLLSGSFTTCEQRVPDWSFRMKKATIHVDHYVYLSHVSMWVKRVPVLYLPYWIYPIKPRRTTGFLMPEFGSDSRLGSYFRTSFFWAIRRNMDATFGLDCYDSGTFGQSLEFRYLLSPDSWGSLYTYHISEKPSRRPEQTSYFYRTPSERWEAYFRHQQSFGYGIKGTADVHYISDKQFPQDYTWSIANRAETVTSQLNLSKSWSRYHISATVLHSEGLDISNPYESILQKLPELDFNVIRQPIRHTPLFFQFNLQAASLVKRMERVEKKTNRFDIYPEIIYPLSVGRWLSVSAKAGLRTTWYIDSSLDLSDLDVGYGKVKTYSTYADFKGDRVFDREHLFERVVRNGNDVRREIYDFELSCMGPSVHRIFDAGGWAHITKIEHLIVPAFHFTYLPAVNQSALYEMNLPGFRYPLYFDSVDYLGLIDLNSNKWGSSVVTYSLTNRLRAKIVSQSEAGEPKTEYRDLLTFTVSQQYDFRRAQIAKEKPAGTLTRYDRPFSDVGAYLSLWLTDRFSASSYVQYDPYANGLRTYNFAASVKGPNWFAKLDWRNTNYSTEGASDIRFVGLRLGFSPDPRWEFGAESNYDIVSGTFPQNNYSITYHSQCWSVTFFAGHQSEMVYKPEDQKYHREDDTHFSISVSLKNVGSSKIPFL